MHGNIVSLVLDIGYLSNNAANNIETLLAYESNQIVTFPSDTSLLNETAIIQNFDRVIDE
jgi:hypothetical protein